MKEIYVRNYYITEVPNSSKYHDFHNSLFRNGNCYIQILISLRIVWRRRGRDRMVVGFTTTYVLGAYHQ